MRLRTYLILLVVAAVLPVVIFAGVTTYVSYQQQRAAQEQELVNIAHALSLAVDRELSATIRALDALAT